MDEIGVDYEYGALREVILGLPIMRYPDAEQAEWVAKGLDVLPDSEGEKVRARSGKHSRRDLDKYEQMEAENDELLEVLDRFDVKVYRPSEITDEQVAANYGEEWLINGYIQSFSRDPIFVVGEDAIALEGGDLLALGKTVLAGTSLNPTVGSSVRGVEWLRGVLKPQGYEIEHVPIGENFLHLDVALSRELRSRLQRPRGRQHRAGGSRSARHHRAPGRLRPPHRGRRQHPLLDPPVGAPARRLIEADIVAVRAATARIGTRYAMCARSRPERAAARGDGHLSGRCVGFTLAGAGSARAPRQATT